MKKKKLNPIKLEANYNNLLVKYFKKQIVTIER